MEILLATVIAAMVLAALYTLMNVTLQQTQATRDANEVEDVSRGVLNKITVDLGYALAPLPPKSGGNPAASGGATDPASGVAAPGAAPATGGSPSAPIGSVPAAGPGGAAPPATSTTPPTTTTPPATDASGEPTTPGATDNSTAAAADYLFQAGVVGSDKKLVILAGKVPEVFGHYRAEELQRPQVRADQRQIIYWLGDNGGLYRRERPWVTADDVRLEATADATAPDSLLISEEVVDLTFGYFDPALGDFVSSWDGTAAGPDGVTPLGPPRAVKVELTLQIPSGRGEPLTKTVSQVIAVRSAPGAYTPPLLAAPTYGGDNGAGETSSGSTPGSGSTPSGGSTPSSPSTPSTPSGGTPSTGKSGGTTPAAPAGGGKAPSAPAAPSGGGKSGGKGGGR